MLLLSPDITTQTIDNAVLHQKKIRLQVLRLDGLHPIISGNKLFKLYYFLEEIRNNDKKEIITFGGAYSNHLVATAFACKLNGIASTGIVRGEKPSVLSHTLEHCIEYGMQLQFISRQQYGEKSGAGFIASLQQQYPDAIVIPEGGYAALGAKGASLIMKYIPDDVTHICCAAGTATTAAGLLLTTSPLQQVIVFPVLKGMHDIEQRILRLTGKIFDKKQLYIDDGYHFGGYAKKTAELLQFMNAFYKEHQVPIDFVYTAKMLYGTMDMIEKNFFPAGSKVLCIHTGGLQGNLSLAPGTLTF